MTLHQCCVT